MYNIYIWGKLVNYTMVKPNQETWEFHWNLVSEHGGHP